MLLKTKVPGRIVQRRERKPGGGYRIKPWFRFNDEGYAEIDETKLTKADIIKLKSKFEVVEKIEEDKLSIEEIVLNKIAEVIENHDVKKAQEKVMDDLKSRKPVEVEELNIHDMSYQDLKKLCKERDIQAGRVSKEELIKLLEV